MSKPRPERKWPDHQHELHGVGSFRPKQEIKPLPFELDELIQLVLDDYPAEVHAYRGYPDVEHDIALGLAREIRTRLIDQLYEDALTEDRLHSAQLGERLLEMATSGQA